MVLLSDSTAKSNCFGTLLSVDDCIKYPDGFYPLQILTSGKKLFPQIFCEKKEITILKREATDPESSYRNMEEVLFNYNQGEY